MNSFSNFRFLKQLSRRWGLALLGVISAIAVLIFGGCGAFQSSELGTPPNILVDQFGYRPNDPKVAVIQQANATPEDEPQQYQHLSGTFQVIRLDDAEAVVFEAPAQLWEAGKIHEQSGDRAAWFDFSEVQQPGEYLIRNVRTGESSFPFAIADDVYRDIRIAATRMFYYQRSGFEKSPPYADPRWTDEAAFIGPGQDTEARFVDDKDNAALERDMRGGWFDAGDTNKYVTFASHPLHQLLSAYTQNPAVWTDDFNIPESNNGVPDLLDEIRFELDWFQRMQDNDGGVFIKLGTLDHNTARKPSLDKRPRFYGPKCSSSTIALASTFAHAAVVFQDIPGLQAVADTLEARSLIAWDWFLNHSMQTECDTQEIKAGDADRTPTQQIGLAVIAAVYLSQLSPEPRFHDYIRNHFQETRPLTESLGAIYSEPVVDALFTYSESEAAPADLRQAIKNTLIQHFEEISPPFGNTDSLDPYGAFMPDGQYHWGSNAVKSYFGILNLAIANWFLPENPRDYIKPSLGAVHYLHGVNPLGIVYLTNTYEIGAEFTANEMFHEWFGGGVYDNAKTSPNGPAPGYITGGPNRGYTGSAPLAELPPMRAYLDKNDPELYMWEITEPSIAYQAAYIKLLSNF